MRLHFSPQLFLLFFSLGFSGFAQHTVEGKVVDIADKPVAFANVILYNAADSTTVYKGAVTSEEGVFKFPNIEENPYLLKVSFVGYKDFLKKIKVSKNDILEPVVLEEAAANLDEVSINYVSPTVKREVDRIVFDVENSVLSSGTSWDILKKTPGVVVANNTLQVRNQGVQVYINDRKVQLSASELQTLLENYSAENIKSVEVITTPPARYDAEGGAILNIVTTKVISLGYKGSVSGAYIQGVFPKYTFGTSHYYKTNNLNLFANYSYAPRKEFKDDDSHINFRENGQVVSRWLTDFDRLTRSKAHNANLILDYNFDEKNILNFSSSFTSSPDKTFHNTVNTRIKDNLSSTPDRFETHSFLEEDLSNIALNMEYKHLIGDAGAQLSLKGHYTKFDQERRQDVETINFSSENTRSGENSFFTDSDQDIDIWTGQLDYNTPIGSTDFEAGAKISGINSESGIDYLQDDEGVASIYQELSDKFLYDEKIYAAYLSLSKDWETWSLKTGLRGEYTDRNGNSESMEQVDTREYFELFPTLYLQHTFNPSHILTFDYSRRIVRPRYESLNPFRYYLNEYDYNAGNPNLKAAVSNNFNLNYTLKGAYFFDLYYKDNGHLPETLSFQDNEEFTLRRLSSNLLESHSYGLDISHGRSIFNWWYTYAYISFFHEDITFLAVESDNAEVTNELDGFYGSIYNSIVLSKDGSFSGELSLTYIPDFISGSYNLDPMTTLSIGLRKTFWNERAELTLNLEDILDQTNTRLTSRYLNQDNSYFPKPETRYVRLGFKYNFGNFRLSDNQRAIEAAERDRL